MKKIYLFLLFVPAKSLGLSCPYGHVICQDGAEIPYEQNLGLKGCVPKPWGLSDLEYEYEEQINMASQDPNTIDKAICHANNNIDNRNAKPIKSFEDLQTTQNLAQLQCQLSHEGFQSISGGMVSGLAHNIRHEIGELGNRIANWSGNKNHSKTEPKDVSDMINEYWKDLPKNQQKFNPWNPKGEYINQIDQGYNYPKLPIQVQGYNYPKSPTQYSNF